MQQNDQADINERTSKAPDFLAVERTPYSAMRNTLNAHQHHDGYHLTSEGLYRQTVTAMCTRNPTLRWGHIEYVATPDEYGRVVMLDLSASSPIPTTRIDFPSSQACGTYLKNSRSPSSRRLFLLEGLARNYVQVLGSTFNMDPSFFALQKRPSSWWNLAQFNQRSGSLPSWNDPRNFLLRYPEMRYFPLKDGRTQLDGFFVKDVDGHRKIDISRRTREIDKRKDLKGGQFNNVGVVNRAASYWARKYEDGGWDAVLLLDPPAGRIQKTNETSATIDGVDLEHVPFQGGYLDFIPYPEALEGTKTFLQKATRGPKRSSILEDICFYLTEHAKDLNLSLEDPSIVTIFLKKIAVSNWLQLTDYFNFSAHNLEHHFSRNERFDVFTIKTMERWWGDLHMWHRRCVLHCEEVEAILVALRIPKDWMPNSEIEANPMDSGEDFAYIYRRLLWIKHRFELLMNSATGLNAITGNKEAAAQNSRYTQRAREESNKSAQESRKASILTFLATVFVPLSVTAGIFSMSSDWAPGGDKFGYYWAISLPFVFLLGGTYYLFGQILKKSRRRDERNLKDPLGDLEK